MQLDVTWLYDDFEGNKGGISLDKDGAAAVATAEAAGNVEEKEVEARNEKCSGSGDSAVETSNDKVSGGAMKSLSWDDVRNHRAVNYKATSSCMTIE